MGKDGPNRLAVGMVLGTALGFFIAMSLGIVLGFSKATKDWRVKTAEAKTEMRGEVGTYETVTMLGDRIVVITDTRSGELVAYRFHTDRFYPVPFSPTGR